MKFTQIILTDPERSLLQDLVSLGSAMLAFVHAGEPLEEFEFRAIARRTDPSEVKALIIKLNLDKVEAHRTDFGCDRCQCRHYRGEKLITGEWERCRSIGCGHIAQDHNRL